RMGDPHPRAPRARPAAAATIEIVLGQEWLSRPSPCTLPSSNIRRPYASRRIVDGKAAGTNFSKDFATPLWPPRSPCSCQQHGAVRLTPSFFLFYFSKTAT